MCLKYILYIFMSLCSGINGDPEPSNDQLHFESFLPDGSRFWFNRNMSKGDICVVNCFRKSSIPRSVQDFFYEVYRDVFRRQNSTNIRRVFNATILDCFLTEVNHHGSQVSVFRYAKGRQQCILECDNDSFVKTEILKFLRPTSYICNETDFITYSKCYHQVYEDDKDECESGEKCLPYRMTMINYYHERRSKNISWEEAVQVVLNNLCQYIICGNQCRLNELSTRCGEESNQVLIEFYRRVVSSLKQIIIEVYHYLRGKTLPLLTDTCDQI